MTQRRRTLAAVIAALLIAGGLALSAVLLWPDTSSPSGSRAELARFQLGLGDVRAGYTEVARVSPAEGCASPSFDRAGVRRVVGHGIVDCALVKLGRKHGGDVELVYLRLYRYEDVDHASAGIPQLRSGYLRVSAASTAAGSRRDLPVSALGEEAPPGVTFAVQAPGEGHASAFAYWWRRGTVVAALAVGGTLGDYRAGDLLGLAHRIDDRAAS